MTKNEEILFLSEEILIDITNQRLPLYNILLKTSRLSLLLDLPTNVTLFQDWAKYAEQNQFIIDTYQVDIDSAKDRNVSVSSQNPNQYVFSPFGNALERTGIRNNARKVTEFMSFYRTQMYNFTLGIYQKWKFGGIAQSVFDRKRNKTEPILQKIFPDVRQRLNSIEQNLNSENSEDWKNAVTSCRTLIMDIADILNPSKESEDKQNYLNRLKQYIKKGSLSKTKGGIQTIILEELGKRIELTSDLTQGSAHQKRPSKEEAEDIVLYTYLLISDLLSYYKDTDEK
ncbi:MAG: hypothetical protein ABH837_02990 [bacterium]